MMASNPPTASMANARTRSVIPIVTLRTSATTTTPISTASRTLAIAPKSSTGASGQT